MNLNQKRGLRIPLITISLIALIIISAKIYQNIEGWTFLDSIYFTIITFTTIGYGDLTPQTSNGKILTIILSFIGIAIVFYIISLIGSRVFKKKIDKEVSQIKKATREQERAKNPKS